MSFSYNTYYDSNGGDREHLTPGKEIKVNRTYTPEIIQGFTTEQLRAELARRKLPKRIQGLAYVGKSTLKMDPGLFLDDITKESCSNIGSSLASLKSHDDATGPFYEVEVTIEFLREVE
jgi:hypothetical protein